MTNKTPIIWAMLDDRAGNNSQVLGVIEALDVPYIVKNIRFTQLGRISNIIKGKSLFGMTAESKKEICPPWPDIVFSIARKMEPVALYIKKNNPSTKLVHIQKSYLPAHNFDLVAAPEHDFLSNDNQSPKIPPNVLITLGAPNRITPQVLATGRAKWETQFSHLPHPRIAVLVGGSTSKAEFTKEHAHDLAQKANTITKESGGSLLVTTSRRTPVHAIEILQKELHEPKYFYDATRSTSENPYAGLLACSDVIIPSGDSVSMCSESCSTGKPVYIYSPESLTPPKYSYFQQKLVAGGYAHMLGDKWENTSYTPLSDAKIIAEYIKKNYF